MLSLSYLKPQSDESFSKAESYKHCGWKSGKKRPEGLVIDMDALACPSLTSTFTTCTTVRWNPTKYDFGDLASPRQNSDLEDRFIYKKYDRFQKNH